MTCLDFPLSDVHRNIWVGDLFSAGNKGITNRILQYVLSRAETCNKRKQ